MNFGTVVKMSVVGAMAAIAVSPQAAASYSYGTQTVRYGSGYAAGYGTLTVQFTTARNTSKVFVSALNGKAGYTSGRFWNLAGNGVTVRSKNTANWYWTDVSTSRLFGAPTYGPWYGAGKTCVDVPWWFDTCSGESSGRV